MPEENENNTGDGQEAAAEFKPITSQEELNKVIGERIGKVKSQFSDYDDLKAKAAKLADFEEANKSEIEKAAERAKQAEERAQKAETEALRFRIANEYKLSQEDALALEHVGSEDGMKAVADRLRARAEAERPAPPKPKSLKSGSSSSEPTGEKGRAAAALRTLRQG